MATRPCFWIRPAALGLTPRRAEVTRRGRGPPLWAWYLIIHPLSLARTARCHLLPRLPLRGSPAGSSLAGSSGCRATGEPLLMPLLGERVVPSLGPALLPPWSHRPPRGSRRPKEPARPSSEQTGLGWRLGNPWKGAWGPGRPALRLGARHPQVSPCLRCFTSAFFGGFANCYSETGERTVNRNSWACQSVLGARKLGGVQGSVEIVRMALTSGVGWSCFQSNTLRMSLLFIVFGEGVHLGCLHGCSTQDSGDQEQTGGEK